MYENLPPIEVPMTFDDYTDAARETAIYPREKALEYLALGLASEAGEVAGKIKKYIRDDYQVMYNIGDELGDVLWYLTMLADELDFSLAEVAERNVAKLRDRQARGALSGSGDER
jgi:NTP pyrophosphatase (non-canonical NTP hydrolase)